MSYHWVKGRNEVQCELDQFWLPLCVFAELRNSHHFFALFFRVAGWWLGVVYCEILWGVPSASAFCPSMRHEEFTFGFLTEWIATGVLVRSFRKHCQLMWFLNIPKQLYKGLNCDRFWCSKKLRDSKQLRKVNKNSLYRNKQLIDRENRCWKHMQMESWRLMF